MRGPWTDLWRWLVRARPPARALTGALLAGTFATLTGLALFVGAPYLLYYSVTHSSLASGSTLAVLLIAIELLAFLRAPSRYAERLSSHDLGLRSVTQWRRWLTATVGTWPYRRWSAAATGDLLDRALADTDALQDLWLRGVVPIASSLGAAVVADVVVIALPGPTTAAALTLLGVQLVALGATAAWLGRLSLEESAVRHARAGRTSVRVELQAVAGELRLLGAGAIVAQRLTASNEVVARVEATREHTRTALAALGAIVAILALPVVYLLGSLTSLGAGEQIVVMLVAVSVADLTMVVRASVIAGASVTSASGRLDSLEHVAPFGHQPFPEHAAIDVQPVGYSLGDSELLSNVEMVVAPGLRLAITGANGSGKSTLLRLLARLDELPNGSISIGGTDLNDIDEGELRAQVAYVPASPQLLSGIVSSVMTMGRQVVEPVDVALSELGIEATPTQRWTVLSRGEAQRAALARALLSGPRIVLLDEPTSGLGHHERQLVLRRLERLDATVIITTHDTELIEWCDASATLRDGRLSFLNR